MLIENGMDSFGEIVAQITVSVSYNVLGDRFHQFFFLKMYDHNCDDECVCYQSKIDWIVVICPPSSEKNHFGKMLTFFRAH